jgi:hypothetical protein
MIRPKGNNDNSEGIATTTLFRKDTPSVEVSLLSHRELDPGTESLIIVTMV